MVSIEDQPWFVVAGICDVLEWSKDNMKQHLSRTLDSNEKKVMTKTECSQAAPSLIVGRAAWVSLISESGLYKLIMRSDKPQAKAFQDWVTKEVLPSIRKTGAYVVGQPSLVENPKMDPLD